MITKQEITEKARQLGFADIGFTDASPFVSQKDYLLAHQEEYGWAEQLGLNLLAGTDPQTILRGAKSIIVLLSSYFEEAFPLQIERYFGRCYLDDDRITKDGMALKIKDFRRFLKNGGTESKVPFNLPHRLAAARAGLGTFGKNSLFYATRAARGSSFVLPVALVVDTELEPDPSTVRIGCPDWCRNACIAACPTRALLGGGRIDPSKCVSFLSYYGDGLTPPELREPMGLYVYGCDRCQNVCPRNAAWMTEVKPINPRVSAKTPDFALPNLLHMDRDYFLKKIWPHMFYISPDDLWRWQMNAARAMGNSLNRDYIPHLNRAITENPDIRVREMCTWALNRIGADKA